MLWDELRMLHKVADFYRRNPAMEKKINTWDEPAVDKPHPDDEEVINYLRHNFFRLDQRMPAVAEALQKSLHRIRRVPCPQCRTGRLRLVADVDGDAAAI